MDSFEVFRWLAMDIAVLKAADYHFFRKLITSVSKLKALIYLATDEKKPRKSDVMLIILNLVR